ncbi:MAG: hypothetical protein QG670_509 [Thermoproteota archaeon]|nr:hypothetical protein [Thermoproteota archaeon]
MLPNPLPRVVALEASYFEDFAYEIQVKVVGSRVRCVALVFSEEDMEVSSSLMLKIWNADPKLYRLRLLKQQVS